MIRMTTFTTSFVAVAAAALLAGPAWSQSKTIEGKSTTVKGTVEAIDYTQRTLAIKDGKGEFHEVDVPAGAKGFANVKVGDTLKMTFYDNVVLRLKQPGEADVNSLEGGITAGAAGAQAGTVAKQRTITATITAVDRSVPSISFSGPSNWKYSSRVRDAKALDKVKVGDKVDITWTAAQLISLEPAR